MNANCYFFFLPGVKARRGKSIPEGSDPLAQGSLFIKSCCRALRKADWRVSFFPLLDKLSDIVIKKVKVDIRF